MVKINRSFPAPESLAVEAQKACGSYSCPDVVERLKEDFHNKCYLCEMKELQDPQIEHLLPHKNGQYPERKFDWNNLFWSCGHCNGVKNQQKYDAGILDCCKKDPEKVIIFQLLEKDILVQEKDSANKKAALTAQLVTEIFNLRNTGMRVYKSDLRLRKLQEEMNVFYAQLEAYKNNPTSRRLLRTMAALLKRESAFAAFKRCYIRERIDEFPALRDYIA